MKNLIFTFVFVLVAQLSLAQDEAFKKDIMKVMEMSGSNAQLNLAKEQILKMVPADKQAAFITEFNASLPSYYDKIAKVYSEVYTKEDIKAMIAFYESPVGKKMSSKSGELAEKSMVAQQEWGTALQPMIMKYVQQ
jgi:hypothetical protein